MSNSPYRGVRGLNEKPTPPPGGSPWGSVIRDTYFDPHTDVVERPVNRLRRRLNTGVTVDAIQSVRGVGYWLLAAN